MNNIDPVLFLQPISAILIGILPLVYLGLKKKGSVRIIMILASAVAYFTAIIAKAAVQLASAHELTATLGPGITLALYYGIQTSIFEVGLAYVIVWYTNRRVKISLDDAPAYGLGLSLWENGVYLGVLSLVSLASVYVILMTNTAVAQQTYKLLLSTQPALFLPANKLLTSLGYSALERVSSMFAHYAWGVLVMMAVLIRRTRYLAYALPMGLVDVFAALYQFHLIGIAVTEIVIFIWGFVCFTVAFTALRKYRSEVNQAMEQTGTTNRV